MSLWPSALFFLTGCSSLRGVQPTLDLIDIPPRNEITTANIGDTLVSKGIRYTFDAIQTSTPLTKGAGLTLGYEIPPQKLPAIYEDDRYVYFQAQSMISKDLLYGALPAQGGICRSKTDPSDVGVYVQPGFCAIQLKNSSAISDTRVAAVGRTSFVQELIYNGRSGDIVKFLYREFSDDLIRGAFSQDIQYDLNDGNEIGFKEVRLEILNATNTEIEYRVSSIEC